MLEHSGYAVCTSQRRKQRQGERGQPFWRLDLKNSWCDCQRCWAHVCFQLTLLKAYIQMARPSQATGSRAKTRSQISEHAGLAFTWETMFHLSTVTVVVYITRLCLSQLKRAWQFQNISSPHKAILLSGISCMLSAHPPTPPAVLCSRPGQFQGVFFCQSNGARSPGQIPDPMNPRPDLVQPML